MMAFLACFVVMAAIIAVNYAYFRRLSDSMQFFELAEELNSNILEMRRYEKNYFLYRQEFSFEENLTFTNRLALTLTGEKESFIKPMGVENYERMVNYVQDYAGFMGRLHQEACKTQDCAELQGRIRGIGQNLNLLADQLVATERRSIDRFLRRMIPLPMINLFALLFLLGFVIFFIGEKVVRPLARITRESEAVASGAFQRITPYGDEKNEIHALVAAINRMVAELEKRQEQLIQSRKIASIGTLTAGIAHEINNPINNISLILESLVEDSERMDNEERQKLYQEAMDQADRTSEIVKNLLEFSRVTQPRIEMVNLEEIIDRTSRLIKNELKLNKIQFVKESKNGPFDAYLDKGGLQQVFLNLFLNSMQAMEEGGVLQVVISPSENPAEVRIDVKDNGPGIPAAIIDRVFDPFFTTKKEGVGTGLGLSVSYNIVKKNGGRIEVRSEPNRETCFSIYLPLAGKVFAEI